MQPSHQHIAHSKTSRLHSSRSLSGFTLVELLVVIAIISIMLVASGPAISALASSGNFTNSINQVAQAFDLARQRAIAKNTYVWVAIHSGTNGSEPEIGVCVVESRTGTDELDWKGSVTLPSNSNLNFVQRTIRIPRVELIPAGQLTKANIPSLPAPADSPSDLAQTVSFRFAPTQAVWAGDTFDHVVQFAPNGEARVSQGLVDCVELGLRQWPQSKPAVIRLSGITGLSTVYY